MIRGLDCTSQWSQLAHRPGQFQFAAPDIIPREIDVLRAKHRVVDDFALCCALNSATAFSRYRVFQRIIEALKKALDRYGPPEIFNTDQGARFTSAPFTETLSAAGVKISMDGKGRYLDNIFIERLWRSLKYEEVFTRAYTSVADARMRMGMWLSFYNDERKHQALAYKTPRQIFEADRACGYVHNASALHTSPQSQQQERDSIDQGKMVA